MSESTTATKEAPKSATVRVVLDQRYLFHGKFMGPGPVEFKDRKQAEEIQATVDRNTEKRQAKPGDRASRRRVDGSLTNMNGHTRIRDDIAAGELSNPASLETDNVNRKTVKKEQTTVHTRRAKKSGKSGKTK